jgi:hypothetical protein
MRVKAVALALALMTPLVSFAEPADKTVWRVGAFNGSSGEIARGEPHGAVHFVTNKDQPRPAWYAFAPVAWAGKPADPTSAPRAIEFSITGRPEAAYRLKASLLIEHSSVPALRVGINGRLGMFYLRPRLDYNMGDMVAAFYPAYARSEVEVDFPGSWLKTGFFQKRGPSIDHRVDVFVRYGQRPRSGRVEFAITGHTFSEPLHDDQEFGEERIPFKIPEFAPGTPFSRTE